MSKPNIYIYMYIFSKRDHLHTTRSMGKRPHRAVKLLLYWSAQTDSRHEKAEEGQPQQKKKQQKLQEAR